MSVIQSLVSSGGAPLKAYIDELFVAYTRSGTGATQIVTTGIDADLVISKGRSGATDWAWYDTERGATKDLASNTTAAQTTEAQGLTAFSSTGHTWGTLAKVNTNGATYVDFVFRKAPKFFDVVTYTGNGVSGRTIAHSLGQAPGMIFYKRTDTTSDWNVYHRSIAVSDGLVLNSTAATASGNGSILWAGTAPTASVFSVGANVDVNASGGTYVAYLFAHDTGTDGLIQCGSYVLDGANPMTVTLGWEPQYVMWKASSITGNWFTSDTSRGMPDPASAALLFPNLSNAESTGSALIKTTATGFVAGSTTAGTYVYLAIRRPNKPPTSGTQVYNAIARTGTGAAATVTGVGFAPDLVLTTARAPATDYKTIFDRLRGALLALFTPASNAEASNSSSLTSFNQDGVSVGTDPSNATVNVNAVPYVYYFFKRAPGVFDVVCYTGTGVARTVAHNLAAVPELIITKSRSVAGFNWTTYYGDNARTLYLNVADPSYPDASGVVWNLTTPTNSVFSLGTWGGVNQNGTTYIAYLFATLAGISKVGSYTGNGSSQTINCGFAAGARFVLIKRTDSTGDWYVWDSTRGIIAGNDPHLSLNTTAAEVTTDDSVDADATGFIVNQLAATNINVNAATYVYLAFA